MDQNPASIPSTRQTVQSPQPQTTSVPLPSRTPRSVIIFLLLFFPPLAWIFMIIDKSYHHWIAKFLGGSGIFTLLYVAFTYLSVGRQVSQLYSALGLEQSTDSQLITYSMIGTAVFAILQIFLAVYFHSYLKKHAALNKIQLAISTIIVFSSMVVAFIPTLMIIRSIYGLSNAI